MAESPRPARVLVVDDSVLIRQVTLRQLATLGCEASEVQDGEAALEACRAASFDLVLMDLHMPGIDGADASRAICESCGSDGSPPRIVGLTGETVAGLLEDCLAAGMSDVLVKPASLDDLRAQIELATAS